MTTNDSDFSPQEKAGLVGWKLARGDGLTIPEVAETFSMSYQGARRIMHTISRVLPIAPNDSGVWRRFDAK